MLSASSAPSCERVAMLFAAVSISCDIASICCEDAAVSSMAAASSCVVADTSSISWSRDQTFSSISSTIPLIFDAWSFTSPISVPTSQRIFSRNTESCPKSSFLFKSAGAVGCEKSPRPIVFIETTAFFNGTVILRVMTISRIISKTSTAMTRPIKIPSLLST